MLGAIIGDLAGSIYEYGQVKEVKEIEVKNLIEENSFYSDDTILTIAIVDSILHDKDYTKYLKEYGNKYLKYKPNFSPYFRTTFSPGFEKWLKGDFQGTSAGNGAMMRISPVGFMFSTEKEVLENAKQATIPSHNTEESIRSAQIISLIIYYLKQGMTKQEIVEKMNLKIEYKPFEKFNTTCKQTINNCLYAFFTTDSFEQSIRTVISYGADTDTNASIVGAMAEACYGIDTELINQAKAHLPQEFVQVLDETYKMIEKNKIENKENKENSTSLECER